MKQVIKTLPFLALLFWVKIAQAVNIPNPVDGFLIEYDNNTFPALLLRFIQLLLGVVGIIAMLFIIIGGFQLITSRGDEEQATSGKKTLTNAIIGLIIVILSYMIVAVVINALKPGGGV